MLFILSKAKELWFNQEEVKTKRQKDWSLAASSEPPGDVTPETISLWNFQLEETTKLLFFSLKQNKQIKKQILSDPAEL